MPNEAVTVSDLVRTVLEVVGSKLEPEIQNPDAPYEEEHLDNSKARKLLGWTPAHDLRAGLAKTLEWYRAHRHVEQIAARRVTLATKLSDGGERQLP